MCRFQSGIQAPSCPKAAQWRRVTVNLTVWVAACFYWLDGTFWKRTTLIFIYHIFMLISNTERLHLDLAKEQGWCSKRPFLWKLISTPCATSFFSPKTEVLTKHLSCPPWRGFWQAVSGAVISRGGRSPARSARLCWLLMWAVLSFLKQVQLVVISNKLFQLHQQTRFQLEASSLAKRHGRYIHTLIHTWILSSVRSVCGE